eukprot:UN13050
MQTPHTQQTYEFGPTTCLQGLHEWVGGGGFFTLKSTAFCKSTVLKSVQWVQIRL